ncbi:hypothetical protein [Teredinibacter purpureus]|uniref:hypothetical protein n=1 Tax=Teredinibacter purpureus TaxID=2731756 RepID=UPI000699025F|nr:hypothetical protein [Teredinibacter purpureus]
MKKTVTYVTKISHAVISLLLGVLATGLQAAENPCAQISAFGAIYSLVKTAPAIEGAIETPIESTFALWRRQGQVAHDYRDRNITLLWNKTSNNRLRAVQAFNAHERSIEYEAHRQGDLNSWQNKRQFFSEQLMQSMTLIKREGTYCAQKEMYSSDEHGQTLLLEWLPAMQVVSYYSAKTTQGMIEWRLDDIITDRTIINAAFAQWEGYASTDYADIGDNESDPFLLNMINLGFIEHGSNGFYTASGQSMGTSHAH